MTYDLASILRAAHAKARNLVGTINLDGSRMSYRQALSRGLTAAWREAKRAATVTAAQDRAPVRVRVTDFRRGVRNAKALGGRFDRRSKTWSVPAARWASANATTRGGLALVAERHEPNCPAYYGAGPCECHSH